MELSVIQKVATTNDVYLQTFISNPFNVVASNLSFDKIEQCTSILETVYIENSHSFHRCFVDSYSSIVTTPPCAH